MLTGRLNLLRKGGSPEQIRASETINIHFTEHYCTLLGGEWQVNNPPPDLADQKGLARIFLAGPILTALEYYTTLFQ